MDSAIFLDRDGVIIKNNPAYVRSLEDIRFYSQALQAISMLTQSPYKIFIITNQSAIARGLLSIDLAQNINFEVVEEIFNSGGRIDDVFMCPHSPEDFCLCRKPMPGLILQAALKFQIDLQKSLMIGDALSDILAGQAAGVGRNILVLTGRGKDQYSNWDRKNPKSFEVYDNLLSVTTALLQ